jgi:hypothetical protein
VRWVRGGVGGRAGAPTSLRDRARSEGTTIGAGRPPAPPPAPSVTYNKGQRVFHPKFGEGFVTEITDRSGDQEVAVEFVRHGPKRLLASLAAMDILD